LNNKTMSTFEPTQT